jgi:predicted  nucleic acid-binding Zn-ribbon protein
MMVEIQLWHMVTLLLSFFGAVWGFWKYVKAKEDAAISEDKRDREARLAAIQAENATAMAQIRDLVHKVALCEKDVEHLKNAPVFAELRGEIATVGARQESVRAEISQIRGALSRIEDFLLNRRN